MPDLILTGIPRSGTTLAAAMLDGAPDTLCLSEPQSHINFLATATNAEDFVARVGSAFEAVRRKLLSGEPVLDRRHHDGSPITNYFAAPDSKGLRRRSAAYTLTLISRPGLSPDFLLGAKHNALYTAVLPEITNTRRFRIIATVRDPVRVVCSWQSIEVPVHHGKLPAAVRFWAEMRHLTHSEMDLLDKQVRIHDLFCRRFLDLAEHLTIVRYETLVNDPTGLLIAAGLDETSARRTVERWQSEGMTSVDRRQYADAVDAKTRNAIAARVRQLCAGDEIPGTAAFYPEYAAG
jgi:hypothetical protein